MSPMILGVAHTGISVRDMERSIKWYEALGLRLESRVQIPGSHVEIAMLSAGSGLIELVRHTGGYRADGGRGPVDHVALLVDGIDRAVSRLGGVGVRMVDQEPRTIPGGSRILFVEGPDGERIELFERRGDIGEIVS